MSERRIVSVSVLVNYIKGLFDRQAFQGVRIEGEVSNFRCPSSGHWYFSLKDETATISCVMFNSYTGHVGFVPNNGDKVVVTGDVTTYVQEGRLQIKAYAMHLSGVGEMFLKYEQLKKKLAAEGLFSPMYKKPIPMYPMHIGVVTGMGTAASADALVILKKRWPVAEVTEYVAPMQGVTAAPKIIEALQKADQNGHGLIILCRGGGSIEDLWCFNDEALARFIFQMQTPIATGVGHETDTTLVDYVSDLASNTPTGAVMHTTPDIVDVKEMLHQYQIRLQQVMRYRMDREKTKFQQLANSPVLQSTERITNEKSMQLDYLNERLLKTTNRIAKERARYNVLTNALTKQIFTSSSKIQSYIHAYENRIGIAAQKKIHLEQARLQKSNQNLFYEIQKQQNAYRNALEKQMRLLDAYSPLKVLDRGYSIAMKDNHVITDVHQVQQGDEVSIRMTNGTIQTVVKDTKEEK